MISHHDTNPSLFQRASSEELDGLLHGEGGRVHAPDAAGEPCEAGGGDKGGEAEDLGEAGEE